MTEEEDEEVIQEAISFYQELTALANESELSPIAAANAIHRYAAQHG